MVFSNQNDLWDFLEMGTRMGYALPGDLKNIENEAAWDDRDNPKTLYGMLSRTVQNFPNHDAVSYQIFLDQKTKQKLYHGKICLIKQRRLQTCFVV